MRPTRHAVDCRAALDLIDAVAALSGETESDIGVGIAVRIGVTSGTVVVGEADARRAIGTGDPVNVAARLQQAAPAGGVLIDEATRILAATTITVDPTDVRSVRGRGEGVVAHRLIGVDAPLTRSDGAPLVGRAAVFAQVRDAIAQCSVDQQAITVVLTGPAGIGKSRLVEALSGPWQTRSGACRAYGEPPLAVVAGWVGAPDGLDDDELVTRVERLAADESLLLVAEDIHHASPELLDVLARIGRLSAPIALIATTRDVVPTSLTGATEITIEPRPADDDALGALAVGDDVAGYRVEGIAGRGGMGIVYRARDGALGRLG